MKTQREFQKEGCRLVLNNSNIFNSCRLVVNVLMSAYQSMCP